MGVTTNKFICINRSLFLPFADVFLLAPSGATDLLSSFEEVFSAANDLWYLGCLNDSI